MDLLPLGAVHPDGSLELPLDTVVDLTHRPLLLTTRRIALQTGTKPPFANPACKWHQNAHIGAVNILFSQRKARRCDQSRRFVE